MINYLNNGFILSIFQALLVTGGGVGFSYLSSTEIYLGSTWSYAASLPSARAWLSAATLDNSVFVFGKYFIIYNILILVL